MKAKCNFCNRDMEFQYWQEEDVKCKCGAVYKKTIVAHLKPKGKNDE